MDGSQSSLVDSLENQLRRLSRVAETLQACQMRLGQPGDGAGDTIWRGPAHNAWLWATDVLRAELVGAHERVQRAADSSRRAIATMRSRG